MSAIVPLLVAAAAASVAFNLRRAPLRERLVVYAAVVLCVLYALPSGDEVKIVLGCAALVCLILSVGIALLTIRRALEAGEKRGA